MYEACETAGRQSGGPGTLHDVLRQLTGRGRRLGNPTTLVIAQFGYAIPRWQDEPDAANAAIEESLRLTEEGASDVVYADTLELLARIEREAGDAERVFRRIARSLRQSIDIGNRLSVTSIQWCLAEALGLLHREPASGRMPKRRRRRSSR